MAGPLKVREGCGHRGLLRAFCSESEVNPTPSTCLLRCGAPGLVSSLRPSSGPPLPPLHTPPVLGTPGLGAVLQMDALARAQQRRTITALPCWTPSSGLPGCRHVLLAHLRLFGHYDPQVLLHRASLAVFSSQSPPVSATASTQSQHLALGLVKPHEMLTCPVFQPGSRSLWIASLPSAVPSAPSARCRQLGVHSIPPSVSLIKMLTSISPQTDPWVPGLHLDTEPLAAILGHNIQTTCIHLSVQHSNAHLSTSDIRRCCGTKTSVALPLSITAITPSPKASRWLRHSRPC